MKFMAIGIFCVFFLSSIKPSISNEAIHSMFVHHNHHGSILGGGVYGAKQCGGEGKFVQLRVAGCDPETPCKHEANNTPVRGEIDFIPGIQMTKMDVKVERFLDGGAPKEIHTEHLVGFGNHEGAMQTIQFEGMALKNLTGKTTQYKWNLFNAADGSLRVCMEAEIQWI